MRKQALAIRIGGMCAACLVATVGQLPIRTVIATAQPARMATSITALVSLVSQPGPANKSPSLETALMVPPAALAQGYLWVQQMLASLPLVETGVTIQTPDMIITPDNIESIEAELQARQSTYTKAITMRGYDAIAGPYQAAATEACKRTHTLWTTSIANGEAGELAIAQDGFEIQIVHTFHHPEDPFSIEVPAVIVESTLVFVDPINSDFILIGTINPGQITVRPDTETNLAAWPEWANPPARSDLEACVVTLSTEPRP